MTNSRVRMTTGYINLSLSCMHRCTLKGMCPNSDNPTEGRWLHGSPNQCIYITTISPTTASVTNVEEVICFIFS